MSKISELSDGGAIQGGDTLIAVRSGGNVKVTYGGSTTANIDGGTIDGTVIGGSTPAAVTTTALVATTADINAGTIDGTVIGGSTAAAGSFTTVTASGDVNFDSGTLFVDASANRVGINTSSPLALLSLSGSSAYTVGNSGRAVHGLDINAPAGGSELFGGAISLGVGGAGRASISAVQGTTDNDTVGLAFATHPSGTGGADAVQAMKIAQNGDISFYEDTGTTPKLFWDASAEELQLNSATNQLTINTGNDAVYGRLDIGHFTNGTFIGTIAGSDTSANILRFGTGGTERMRIDSSGNLGLGNTPSPTSASGYYAFELGASAGSGLTGNNGDLYINENAYVSGGAWKYAASSIASAQYNLGGGVHRWFNAAAGTANNNITWTQAMTLDASGDLGIGETSPDRTLHVNSGLTNVVAKFESTDEVAAIEFVDNGGSAEIGCISNNLVFFPAGAEKMRLDSSGNLLVGTTATIGTTDTTGSGHDFRATGAVLHKRDGGTVQFLNRLSTNGDIVDFRKDGTAVGSISVTASATAYNTSSDERLKENITDANDAGDKIDAIKVRQYDWKVDGSHQDYGMVAQELMTVAPEAVSGDPESDDMMGVDYSKLVPMLIKEIQSLRARVAQLEGAN